MKRKFLGVTILIIILLTLFIPNKASAVTSSGGYTIQDYNIDMVVNENNTFDITETITVYFSSARHGIYRKIPLKNSITRLDGTKSNNRAKITDISVSEDYTTSTEDGYKVIKIGNANSTVTGTHVYTIHYNYNIGKDPLKDADELYFNLIGNEWDTSISKVSFSITMPKDFDKSSLGFSSGKVGSTDSSNIYYNVSGNRITGSTINALGSGQALTVRLTLPEGYFIGASSNVDIFSICVIILAIVFVLIAFLLWKKYGKDDEVVETVEFYPPDGYNSAEIGFMYKGKAETEDIISLLVYLANKGYLEIEETETKGILSKNNGFKITKLREYDGDNECEEMFLDGLFNQIITLEEDTMARQLVKEAKARGEKLKYGTALAQVVSDTNHKKTVTASDLTDHFYVTLNKIKTKLNSKENKNKIFEGVAAGKKKWIIIMAVATWILSIIKPLIEYGEIEQFVVSSVFFVFMVLAVLISNKTSGKILYIILSLVFLLPVIRVVLEVTQQNTIYIITWIIGFISTIILLVFSQIIEKRNQFGNEMLGKIKGFRRFLETAEKEQLEALVEENPKYFYYILPYTYALGVSDKWMKQFETIAIQSPDWYVGYDTFSIVHFNSFMNSTMKSAQTAMSSSPSSDGGSGGGSSGGGSGGGGGGSW